MGLYYKDSVMAKRDNTGVDKDYYNDEAIGIITIKQCLLRLTSTNFHCDGKPTKEQVKKELQEFKEDMLDTISEDFDFYAENVIYKFLEYKKE